MASRKQTSNSIISIGLVVTFLFTAITLPIVSSHSVEQKISICAVKSSSDLSNQGTELPLAEKENEEEEIFNEKDQNISFIFITGPIEHYLYLRTPNRSACIDAERFILSEVPLYLSKRTLLI
jgi:hypothetical protein